MRLGRNSSRIGRRYLWLLLIGVTSAMVLVFAPSARASCTTSGSTVTCDTTTNQDSPDGFGTPATNNLIINVVPSAVVTGDNDGFNFGTGNTVNNSGRVVGTGNDGIEAAGSIAINNASGATITGFSNGIAAVGTGTTTTVTNYGTISATGTGFGSTGIAADTANVTNYGTITGENGIFANATGNITNYGMITGSNGFSGIQVFIANITNYGTISASGSFNTPVDVDTGTVTNYGTITSTGSNGKAIDINTDATVNNFGTISANSSGGFGISSENNVTVNNSGTVNANGSNGTGIAVKGIGVITNSGTINANGNNGVAIFGDTSSTLTVVNSGTISATGNNGAAILGDQSVTVTNTGTIIGTSFGIGAGNDSTVTNAGTLIVGANGTGIQLPDRSSLPASPNVINSGTIIGGDGAFGIYVQGHNNVLNSGTVTVGNNAAGAAVQLDGASNVFTNTGLVQAGKDSYSLFLCNCTTGNTITNSGTLDGKIEFDGITSTLTNSGLITITNSGTAIAADNFLIQTNTFTQTAAGTLALRMNSLGAIDGLQADTVNPGGTLRVVIQPGLYAQTLTSTNNAVQATNTITAPFASYVPSSPFFTATPIYSGGAGTATNFTSLNIGLSRIAFNAVPGLTPNQIAVGTALQNGYSTGLTGNAATFYGNVLAATSVSVLNQLSGEGTSAAQNASLLAGTNFNMAMMQQGAFWQNGLTGGNSVTFGEPTAYAEPDKKPGTDAFASVRPTGFDNRWRVWGLGFGATRSIGADATTGASSQTQRTFGGSFGVDHQIAGDLLIGAAVGASQSTFSVPNLSTNGTIEGGHIGLYGVKTWGANYMNAALSYAHFDNSTTRTITGAGPTEVATGNFGSDQINSRLEAGRKYAFTGYTLTPFVATEPGVLFQRAYSETSTAGGGPGILGLNYLARTTSSLPTFLGMQVDTHEVMTNGYAFDPYARVSWVHEFMPKRQIEASFITVPGPSFTVDGARAYTDAARINTGVKVGLARDTVAFLNVEGEFASNSQSYSATAGMQTTW